MSYIILIGTPFNAPPSAANPEMFSLIKSQKSLRSGYIHPTKIVKYDTPMFFTRSGFVFQSPPINLLEIKMFNDDTTKDFPYVITYDTIMCNDGTFMHASKWIDETYTY